MDATSLILVFEALKRWRHNKTTIVITHDLSQIEPNDFVYVLKDGRVFEQGFRYDLESVSGQEDGRFRKMMERQSETGCFLPEKDIAVAAPMEVGDLLKQQEEDEELNEKYPVPEHQSLAFHPLSLGSWMFDVVADLTSAKPTVPPLPPALPTVKPSFANKTGRRLTIQVPSSPPADSQFNIPAPLPAAYDSLSRCHQSLQFTPTSAVFSFNQESTVAGSDDKDDDDAWKEKDAVQRSGIMARAGREDKFGFRSRGQTTGLLTIKIETPSPETTDNQLSTPSFWSLTRSIYPTIPNKPLFLGLLFCLLSGSMTPIFSFLLSRLSLKYQ